jgi:glycosyltransferase involved in cell wall biosynthesis
MDISVVIPVYNEEENIRILYRHLKKAFLSLKQPYEFIFVNDGSNDHGYAVMKGLQKEDACVKIVDFEQNYGKTSALTAGIKFAKGAMVVTIDADLQYDPQDILRLITELKASGVDAVFGKRMNRTSGLWKVVCSKSAHWFRSFWLQESYQDASLAVYKKKALEKLVLYKNMEVFIPTLLVMQGCKVKEISVQERQRKAGYSKYNFRNRFFRLFYALLVVKWMKENQLHFKIKQVDG